MLREVTDWRIELMEAHPRLFEIMSGEPEHSFGYPYSNRGCG